MSEMKMSDVFGLPLVVCRTNPQMITAKPTYKGKTDFYYATIRSPVEIEVNYATHAINNHDRMMEEIKELKGALVEIRSVSMRTPELKENYTHDDIGILDDRINEAFGIVETALAKLNKNN